MLQAAQIRGARAMLGWRQEDLAKAARTGLATLARIERQEGHAQGHVSTIIRIQEALQREGIRFLDDEGEGYGVRLGRKPRSTPLNPFFAKRSQSQSAVPHPDMMRHPDAPTAVDRSPSHSHLICKSRARTGVRELQNKCTKNRHLPSRQNISLIGESVSLISQLLSLISYVGNRMLSH